MATGLNQRALQRKKRASDSLKNIDKSRAGITESDLEELFRRDMVSIDTYAYSHTGSSIVATNRGNSPELTPTERAAERRSGFPQTGRKQRDPVREDIKKIEKNIFKAEELLTAAVELIKFLREGVEKKKGRQASPPCEACHVLPIVKRGMCSDCYQEWLDAGSPEYSRWILYKNSLRSSEGIVLVENQPEGKPRVQTLDIRE